MVPLSTSLRRYVFPGRNGLFGLSRARKFALLAAINCTLLFVVFAPWKLHSGEIAWGRMVAITYFSYLGVVAWIVVFFLMLGLAARGITRPDNACDSSFQSPEACSRCASTDTPTSPGALPEDSGQGNRGSQGEHPSRQPSQDRGHHVSRRSFLKWGSIAGVGAALGTARHGLAEVYQLPVVEEFDITHPSLHGLSRPMTVIQATDCHYGWFFGSPQLEVLVESLNRLDGDIVVLTGDIFHSRRTNVESSEPILRKLRERRFGNFVILGNHELYTGKARSLASFTRSGLLHLDSTWASLDAGGTIIHLGGLTDPLSEWVRTPSSFLFRELLDREPKGAGMRMLLCHRPSVLSLAAAAGIDLVLTGHTHGGQMIVPQAGEPKGFSPAQCFTPYTHGWYRKFSCRMYVNRGVGMIYVPWRINCPPEIAVFHLSAPPPGFERGAAAVVRRS